MANFNKVLLIGNLTRDPELRYIPSGTAVANFSLATNRVYVTSSGEKKQEVCFVRIVAWGKMAETCGEYLSKGSPVFIEGRLQYRSWEGTNGEKRNTLEVKAERVQFLGRAGKAGAPQKGEKTAPEAVEDINLDAGSPEPNLDGKEKSGGAGSDEVPF
ncbi:MAG: single-stranded DNA-binding protein [Candidatus Omnitrophica bacterium]|nr:single-stranded DNA-binding protein [Candidatus Omnitrophota bacterium]